MRYLVRGCIGLIVLGLALATVEKARADDWPQWLGPKRDGVWRETGILTRFPKDGPTVRWRTPIGQGYSGPAVAHGKVVVTDQVLPEGGKNPDDPFGKGQVQGSERIICLDEATGKILWKHTYECPYRVSYPAGPRATPVISKDKVYTLGTMGDLFCLDLKDGSVIWSKNLPKEYKARVPLWGFAGHPLLDGNRLICLVGGKGSLAVAFDKDTGKEIWRALTAKDSGYAPPMIYEFGGKKELIFWDPENINALNPETGAVLWSQPFPTIKPTRPGLTIATPRQEGDRLFVTHFYAGPLMLKIKGQAEPIVQWRGKGDGEKPSQTDGLHSIMATPIFKDGYIYGVCSYGEMRCLNATTGERLWETYQPIVGKSLRWGNAFIVAQGDRFILFNEKGDLIIARMSPKGYEEISRANILAPTNKMAGRPVVWSHPAFADRCVFARNDREIVCVSMAEK